MSTASGAVPFQAPSYLYRGECGLFRKTESSQVRLESADLLNARELDALRKVLDALRWVFIQAGYDNSEWEAEGLLEHYGVPTAIINFTSSPRIAASFAASERSEGGRICILKRPYNGGPAARTVDFTRDPWAKRALRQKGFGVRPVQFADLKSREAEICLGAVWVEFPLTEADHAIERPRYEYLVDTSRDPHSAMVRSEVIISWSTLANSHT